MLYDYEYDGIEIEIEYDYFPGTTSSMGPHGWDPGWREEIEIIGARAFSFMGVDRKNMHGWEKDLDHLALALVEEPTQSLYNELVDNAQ